MAIKLSTLQKEKDEKTGKSVGRLTAFGVDKSAPWQALLIAPNRYIDLRHVIRARSDLVVDEEGSRAVIEGFVVKPAQYDSVQKRSKMTLVLSDRITKVLVMTFGHPRQLPGSWRRDQEGVALAGNLIVKPDGFCVMFDPTPLSPELIGGAMGIYPSRSGVIGADKVRERVLALLTDDNIQKAADHIRSRLGPGNEKKVLVAWGERNNIKNMEKTSLERIIRRLHQPSLPRQGTAACRLLTDIDAFCALQAIEDERPKSGIFQQVVACPSAVEKRMQALPFPLTDEQRQAVWDFLGDMAKGSPAHRLLSGDVGTGKSAPMALIIAAVYDAGGQVAAMLPSSDIVDQMARDISAWWPDIELEKITAKQAKDEAITGRVRLGTTALIHRCGDWKPTVTIVDEQQRMSVNQRHALTHQVGHLLEATATCLPRTLAQAMFGLIPVSRLTRPHTPKYIHTRIHDSNDKQAKIALYRSIQETLDSGEQVLVIYAARTRAEADKMLSADLEKEEAEHEGEELHRHPPRVASLDEGVEQWRALFNESDITTLHGKMKAKEREASLKAMLDGTAKIMCATTAAEVGLNLPLLRQTVIINAERLGLTQLHQIRGRVARNGGEGRCDLLTYMDNLGVSSTERLEALCSTQDGFALAELDMWQRGLGDLSSRVNQQSGKLAGGIIRNSKLSVEHFEVATALQDSINQPSQTALPETKEDKAC